MPCTLPALSSLASMFFDGAWVIFSVKWQPASVNQLPVNPQGIKNVPPWYYVIMKPRWTHGIILKRASCSWAEETWNNAQRFLKKKKGADGHKLDREGRTGDGL